MELYITGVILKSRGLQGEVKVEIVTDFPETFLSRKTYYAGRTEESAVRLQVRRAALASGFAWLMFKGIDTLEEAGKLTGWKLFVEEAELVPQPEGRAYIHELVGMRVLDRNRSEVGIVTDVMCMPANDVYEVQAGRKKVLIPALGEFIDEISVDGRYMVVSRFDEFL
ncbi:MAG: 16S rRNA processing protein RimM [Chlorobiaceae bacterium]|nr:16S rRNA processing protein RimM [Chlorobiaceae bacterium]NTV61785.1 16S rRNA processing protein RimM [Chlorobiaceae bacterium]